MALLDDLRRQNPKLANYSDDQLKGALRSQPQFQYLSDDEFNAYVGGSTAAPSPDDGDTPGFTGGLAAGIDQVQGMGGGLLMIAGDKLGSDTLYDAGLDYYNEQMAEAQENDLGYGFTDIRSVGDAFNWARYTAGNLTPMLATSIAGGGVGGVAAGAAGKMVAGQAAKAAASRIGQVAGAYAASAGMETGDIMGRNQDSDVALAHGAIAGALDVLAPIKALRSVGANKVADQAATEISEGVMRDLRRTAGRTAGQSAARGSAVGTLIEASTEGLQGLIGQHADYWVANNGESLLANLDEVDVKALVDEAAAGGLMGGTLGAGTGLMERSQAQQNIDRIEAAREQAAAQGGDALDQATAAQNAEQTNPVPESDMAPEEISALGNRIQMTMNHLDDLQHRARQSSYQGQTRLRNIEQMLKRAEDAYAKGNYAQAARMNDRADTIAANLREAMSRTGTPERPAQVEGEYVDDSVRGYLGRDMEGDYLQRDGLNGPSDPRGGATYDGEIFTPPQGIEAKPPQARLGTDNAIYVDDPQGRARREQRQEATRQAFEGAFPRATGQRPVAAERPAVTPSAPRGDVSRSETAYLPDGEEVGVRYRVMELGDVQASNLPDGARNPNYPDGLQPRERGDNAALLAQVRRMSGNFKPALVGRNNTVAAGTPIIGSDGAVESGNGRTMAIGQVYQNNGPAAARYRDMVRREMSGLGMDPSLLDGMNQPVLVRERLSPVEDRNDFARRANDNTAASMSDYEQAQSDATSLSLDLLRSWETNASDNPLAASNRSFVSAFVRENLDSNQQASYLTRDGRPTAKLGQRMVQAVLAKAYVQPDMVEMLLAQDTGDNNLVRGMRAAAADFAVARELGDADTAAMVDNVVSAVRLVRDARNAGQNVTERLQQADAFSDAPSGMTPDLAKFFAANIRRPGVMEDMMRTLGRAVRIRAEQGSGGLLNDTYSNEEVINEAFTQAGQSRESAQPGGRGDRADEQARTEGREADRAEGAAEDAPAPLDLTSYTEEELAAQEAEQTRAQAQEARDRADEDARIQADREVDDFNLTGSDRAADLAVAAGQTDIFGDGTQGAPVGAQAEESAPAESLAESPDASRSDDVVAESEVTQDERIPTRGPLEADPEDFAQAMAEATADADRRSPFVAAERTTRAAEAASQSEPLSIPEARAILKEWKENARQQGESGVNNGRVVVSLFDVSGEWSKPWREAGYDVYRFDIQDGQDINDFSVEHLTNTLNLPSDVDVILAAPPCTDFTSSGARWWAAKDADGRTEASIKLVTKTLNTIEYFKPPVWVMENPVGRFRELNNLPNPRLNFQPHHYGDPYTKKTQLWGDFNPELPQANVLPTEGSKMHKLSGKDKYGRSLTPEGFAYAFFQANNLADMTPAQRLVRRYRGLDESAVQAALDAGQTEIGVQTLIEDQWHDGDVTGANETLRQFAPSEPEATAPAAEAETAPVENTPTNLADTLFTQLDAINDNRSLKKAVAEHHGVTVRQVTEAQLKEAQEVIELALVRRAREAVAHESDRGVRGTFDELLRLYEQQPNLNVRSSGSMQRQAYSTPAPLAYLASRLAGITADTTVYEPTAGNGMLLIGAQGNNIIANELDGQRADQLEAQGFTVTRNDATEFVPERQVDSVIANPPFGKLRNEDGGLAPVKVDGYTIKSLDHLIVAKALSALKDDGRATIIIGASKKPGEIGAGDRVFFNWLYSHYNVVDHFEASGDLYKRQGAGWPVRIITVNGRVNTKSIGPKSGDIQRAETWEQVYERYERGVDAAASPRPDAESAGRANQPDADDGSRPAGADGGQQADATDTRSRGRRSESEGDSGARARSGKRDTAGDQPSRDGASTAPVGEPAATDRASAPEVRAEPVSRGKSDAEKSDAGSLGGRSQGSDAADLSGSEYQVGYKARSTGFNDEVLVPKSMAQPTMESLAELEKRVGNLDDYVASRLAYDSREEMHRAFMGLQVDAVAASIYNIERDKGIIIADQTGVGKGRQAAAVIRYARQVGKTPIFMTVKDNLFSDMYGDLRDIGDHDVKPFVINQGGRISWNGQTVYKTEASKKHRGTLEAIVREGKLPEGHDALFLTYSQIRTDNLQRKVLTELAPNAVFILDEAHEVAGEREKRAKGGAVKKTGAGFIYDLIDSKPVVYLSATYAKRPDNMPVYYRTDVADAVDNVDQLVDAVQSGGVPLQTVMSNMLAQSGQLFRRERSFEGISIETSIDTANTAEHERISDEVTEGLRAIIAADLAFHSREVEDLKAEAEAEGGSATGAGNKASSSVDHQNFTSILHNYISQLLLGLKAERAAQKAIELHRQGIKPVMALENTMGSFLKQFAADNALEDGDPVEANYRDVMSRALERTRRYSVTLPNGDRKVIQANIADLSPGTRELYEEAQATIDRLELGDIPISPIDHIRHRLNEAGISVAELTGRDRIIDYSTPVPTLSSRSAEERKNARGTVDRFNAGQLDSIILNRSGSTGLSIHASERFTDQRPRRMIVLQAPADINILMQMLGRVNRTGQVVKPSYDMMGLNIPAEKRPLAVTSKKMKSLNANTSANSESDTSVNAADILNKYGDQVVNEYLYNNPALAIQLDVEPSSNMDGPTAAPEGLALKVTGRLATLSVREQREVYDALERSYSELIDYLDKTGQNDLNPQTIDLDARIIESKVIYEGRAPGTIFGGHTYLHKVDAKYQGTPPTAKDVREELEKADRAGGPQAVSDKVLDTLAEEEIAFQKSIDADYDRAKKLTEEAEAIADRYNLIDTTLNARVEALQEMDEKKAARVLKSATERAESAKSRADANQSALNNASNVTRIALTNTFAIGNHVRLDLKEEDVTGVVVDVKTQHQSGKGNPWALSKTRVRFMVNSGVRTIELPLTRLTGDNDSMLIEVLRSQGEAGLDSIFSNQIDTERRETRFIATGNLIAASAGKDKGRITSFTDKEGKTHLGMLMPKRYDEKAFAASDTSQNITVRDPNVATKFLRANRAELEEVGGLFSQGQVARIYPEREGGWRISVPRSGKEKIGNEIKFNSKLLQAMGTEFYGRTSKMVANFSDQKLPEVMKALLEIAPFHALPSFREKWEASGGAAAPEAAKTFDTDTRYSLGGTGASSRPQRADITEALKAQPELSDVTVVQTVSELPDAVLRDMQANGVQEDNVRGVYVGDELFVVADNVADVQDGIRVAVHEAVGHKGIRGVLGAELEPVMRRLFRGLKGHPKGRAALQEVLDAYPFLDVTKAEDQTVIAEEMVAHLLEKGYRPSTWKKAVAKIRELLRRAFPSVAWTYTDVLALGEKSRDYLQARQEGRTSGNAVRYSLWGGGKRAPLADQFDDLDDAGRSMMGKFGRPTPVNRAAQWWQEKTHRLALRLRQGLVDKAAALKELDEKLLGEGMLKEDITRSSWVLARMSGAANGALHAMMHNGRVELDPDQKVIQMKEGDSAGLGTVLAQLGDAAEIERFMMWIAANRSDKLMGEGREFLFTEDEIAAGKQFNTGRMKDGRQREAAYDQAFKEFQQYRDDVLGIAEQAGLLKQGMDVHGATLAIAKEYGVSDTLVARLKRADKKVRQAMDGNEKDAAESAYDAAADAILQDAIASASQAEVMSKYQELQTSQRELWANEFYVPFYRIKDDKDMSGNLGTSGLSRQQAYKRLKGGTENINDLLQNTMMNFHHLMDASLKNMAAVQAIDNAEAMGVAREVSSSARDPKSSTFVLRDGYQTYYQIDDPLVHESLIALAHPGMNSTAMKVMRYFKRLFTNLTTTTPQFMVANLIRDSLQASATSDVSKNALKNVVMGGKTLRDERQRAQMLASGASFNFGFLYGSNPDELRGQLTRNMRDIKLINGPRAVPGLIRAGWSQWNRINDAAENLNRAAIYTQNEDKGALRAAFEARDLMDFSAHGAWGATRVLIDIVPFLNARIQGLDKIYRSGAKPGYSVMAAAFGRGEASVSDKQAAARFWSVAGTLAMATIALYLHNYDDEEYQKLEDWQKDTYWFFRIGDQAFFLPKPFEVGAIATMAERITQQFMDDEATGKVFAQRMQHMLFDTFSFSPVPQMMQPALDIYANYDAFTGRPIESMGMERMSPELRKRSSTSKVAERMSQGLNATVGAIGDPDKNPLALSPVQVDHLIGGYFGQVGSWVAGAGDVAWNVATGNDTPESRWYEYQPVKRFYRNLGDEDRYTRYGTVFYEGLREAARAHTDVRELREMGRLADAAERARESRQMLALRKPLNRAQRRLTTINKQIDMIRRSSMDGALKRQRIDRLRAIKNQLQRALGERVLQARVND